MSMMPLVSIVTPSFNQADYIEEAIRSVILQDYDPVEHLIFDGGSTDATAAVAERYADRVRFTSESDRGQAHAVNKGFAAARGEIVGWLNSDDFYYPGALRTVVDYMRAHPSCDALYGAAYYVDEAGCQLRAYPTGEPDDLRFGCFICQPSVFVRRTVLEKVGLLDESLSYCMDYELWLRIRDRHELHRIPEALAAYRLHDSSKTVAGQLDSRREVVRMMHRRYGSAPLTCLYGYADLLVRSKLGRRYGSAAGTVVNGLSAIAATAALAFVYHPIPKAEDFSLIRRRWARGSALAPGSLPGATRT